jgi:hypothetical protein
MLAGANMQIFADPETMSRMSENFMRAASLGNSVDGLLRTMPVQGQELLTKLASTVTSALRPADVPAAPGATAATSAANEGNGASVAQAGGGGGGDVTPVEAKPKKRM